jgi:molybdopterin molybdotransferase
MISREGALRKVLKNVKRLPATRMPLDTSLGHALAKSVSAALDLPPFDKSAMDGFAIAAGDRGAEFEVVGEVAAGQSYRGRVKPGSAVRIMTGAMLPAGAGRVIMKEHVESVGKGRIKVTVEDDRINVCSRGEDVRKGETLYPAGEVITPIVLANLASSGVSQVSAYRKPRVGILTTGSELLRIGQKPERGKIYNSNGPLLRSLLRSMDLEVVGEQMAGDRLPALKKAFSKLLAKSDVVFATGGVSVGEYDLVADVLKDTGCRIHFDRVAVQPGKPFTFATRGKKPIFAFPGNPVSVFASYFLFAVPALYIMMGIDYEHKVLDRRYKGSFTRRRIERELYQPVRFVGGGNVESVGYHGSGHLHALSHADALMVIPVGKGDIRDGEAVKVIELF